MESIPIAPVNQAFANAESNLRRCCGVDGEAARKWVHPAKRRGVFRPIERRHLPVRVAVFLEERIHCKSNLGELSVQAAANVTAGSVRQKHQTRLTRWL